jgi:hypothetical protein
LKDLEQGSSSKEDTGEAWDGRELEGREVAKSRTDAEMWEERRWLANRGRAGCSGQGIPVAFAGNNSQTVGTFGYYRRGSKVSTPFPTLSE